MLAPTVVGVTLGRRSTHKSRRAIAASIKRFGFLVPIIVNRDGMILAGHGRYYACQEDGVSEVPIIRAEFLTEEDKRAFALALICT